MFTLGFRRQVNDFLFSAIAQLMEDKNDIALSSGDGAPGHEARAEGLRQMGDDIRILAEAAAVITRRSAPGRSP